MRCMYRLLGVLLAAAGLAIPWCPVPVALAADPASLQVAAAPPAIPAGVARVWFLRQFEPGESLRTPMIFINGAPLANSQPGTAFFRDFQPGTYAFSVETCTTDFNQGTTLALAPGSETTLEVQSLGSFQSWGCLVKETFYIRPIAPRWAQIYLPQLAYLGAR